MEQFELDRSFTVAADLRLVCVFPWRQRGLIGSAKR